MITLYFLVGLLVIGVLLYGLWRVTANLDPAGGGASRPTREPKPPRRRPERSQPLAPDDNPEFLRELDRRAKKDEPPAPAT